MPVITETEYVSVNGVPLATPAWIVNDLSPLWEAGSLRGDDRIIPFAPGKKPLRRILDELRVVIPITVFGDFDQDGVAQSNARIGLQTNVDYLRDNILTPNPSDPGTWPLVLHLPDGTTRSADCFVLPPFQIQPLSPIACTGVLDILIPSGVLA